MTDSFWKRNEPTWHRMLGAVASLMPGGLWLLKLRERKQFPPENDDHPVEFISALGSHSTSKDDFVPHGGLLEYWSKARVMDTFNDTDEKVQGASFVGWFLNVGWGVLIGWLIWGMES